MPEGQMPPHSLDAERSVLSASAAIAIRAVMSASSPNPAGRLRRYRSRPSRVVRRSFSAVPTGPIIYGTLPCLWCCCGFRRTQGTLPHNRFIIACFRANVNKTEARGPPPRYSVTFPKPQIKNRISLPDATVSPHPSGKSGAGKSNRPYLLFL